MLGLFALLPVALVLQASSHAYASQAHASHPSHALSASESTAVTSATATSEGGDFVPGDFGSDDFIIMGLTVLVLAIFIGYYVVWRVTPALHSPLMSITNAISSVIVVGALIAAGPDTLSWSSILGFVAIVLASVNIFGGFIITQRMLAMYRKRK